MALPRGAVSKAIALLATTGVLFVVILLATLRIEHSMSTSLPAPSGQFQVGRALADWRLDKIDSSAPTPGTQRELLIWMWYPAVIAPSAAPDDYYPRWMRDAYSRSSVNSTVLGSAMTGLLTRDPSKVHTHSYPDAQVSPRERAYPVLVMRAGASAGVDNYSVLAEDLASHGYVVVGFDAPFRTVAVAFPDGRVVRRTPQNNPELIFGRPDSALLVSRLIQSWHNDISFVLDRLTQLNASDSSGRFNGKLDLSRIGLFGHSLGGAAVADFCATDSRCTCGADIDGAPLGRVIETGIPHPFMFLLSDHGSANDPQSQRIEADIDSIENRSPKDDRTRVVISGANHFLFSDDAAFLKSHVLMRTLRGLGVVKLGGPRQLAVTGYALSQFFDACLKGSGGVPRPIKSAQYPELK